MSRGGVPFLSLRGVVKQFPGVLANDRVDFDVAPGQIHALLGENGAGKTTLMQIAYGMVSPDAGETRVEGRTVSFSSPRDAIASRIGMIHQEFMLVPPFTVAENVVLGLAEGRGPFLDLPKAARRIAALSAAHGLAVDPGSKVAHLPIGVRQRVEIVKLLYRDARLLILDEPTALLTLLEVESLFKVLKSLVADGRSVVIVTHKLHEVMDVADSVTIMRDGRIVATGPAASQSPGTLATLMVGREVSLRVERQRRECGPVLMRIRDLRAQGDAGAETLHGVSLDLSAGEILGVAGVDGNGQSELVETIMNLRPASGGEVEVQGVRVDGGRTRDCHDLRVAYIPADRKHVGTLTSLPISENAALGQHRSFANGLGFLNKRAMRSHAEAVSARFGVRTSGVDTPVGKLSGGNLQKLVLGREVAPDPLVLIIEQPTRGLDVGAVEAVWAALLALRTAGKAILLVSSDLEEILNLSDRIAVMFRGRIVGILPAGEASPAAIGGLIAGAMRERADA